MADFTPGLALNESFFRKVVAPLLAAHLPDLPYAAALIGWGSEVLGFDDPQSADHNWGLRFQLFLAAADYAEYHSVVNQLLCAQLPRTFRGHPVDFHLSVNGDQRAADRGETAHNIDIETIAGFFTRYLGCDPFGEIGVADWLTFSEHKLLALTSGRVFHDGLGALEAVRLKFRYYPRDVWLYLLAAQWEKIGEEEAFVGRCGDVGDELGSALIAARQVKNLMRLCFLMEQQYAPYSKWFGTAFARLACAGELMPIFEAVLQASEWQARQAALANAYEAVARMHNALQITIPLREKARYYHGRPYLVRGDDRYVEEIKKALTSAEITRIAHGLGSVNQFVDSTSQLNDHLVREKLKALYA